MLDIADELNRASAPPTCSSTTRSWRTKVLKPSEVAPATSAVLDHWLPKVLDPQAVAVVEGGVSGIRDGATVMIGGFGRAGQPGQHVLGAVEVPGGRTRTRKREAAGGRPHTSLRRLCRARARQKGERVEMGEHRHDAGHRRRGLRDEPLEHACQPRTVPTHLTRSHRLCGLPRTVRLRPGRTRLSQTD